MDDHSAASLRLGDQGPRITGLRDEVARALGAPVQPELPDPSVAGDAGPGGGGELFGDALDRAVRALQQRRGLRIDGVVGPETSRVLEAARWRLGDRVLRFVPGHLQRGDDVEELQRRLIALGLLGDRTDGLLGPRTEQAVRELQRDTGLVVDGTVGPGTLAALQRLDRTIGGGDPGALRDRAHIREVRRRTRGHVVVLDPAHGAGDPGAQGHDLVEADVVLDLARRMEGRLAAAGVTAVLTRGAEQCPSPGERAALAGTVGADVLLSLHCDSAAADGASGVATSSWGAGGSRSAIGARLADLVQRELVARTGLVDCRTHTRDDELLRSTQMPAVRVEIGYLTSGADASRLARPEFRDRCAEAVLVAVRRLFLPEDEDPATGTMTVLEAP